MSEQGNPAGHRVGRETLFTTADIAARADVNLGTVWTWRQRGVLPEPDAVLMNTPVWRERTILRWLAQTGRDKRS